MSLKEQNNKIESVSRKIKEPEAFVFYFSMGPSRSLRRLRQYYTNSPHKKAPSLDTLKYWSKRFQWQERVNKLDKETYQRKLKKVSQRMVNKKIKRESETLEICGNLIEKFGKRLENDKYKPNMADAVRAYNIINEALKEHPPYPPKDPDKINLTQVFQAIFKEAERKEIQDKQGYVDY